QGLIVRPIGHGAQRPLGTLYEYQWKLDPRPTGRHDRDSQYLPTPDALAPLVQREGEVLHQRFQRARFQEEFQSRSRAAVAAYVVKALRELGWTPAQSAAISNDELAARLGLAPQYHRWLRLMRKELTAAEIAGSEAPQRLWKALWEE